MIEDLRKRFLPRFVQGGRERVRRALRACEGERCSLASAITELHALAGEAALLELHVIAELARAGENAARTPGAQGGACAKALREIDAALVALEGG